ncbi:MAG: ArdC family protein [Planctomycetaceae bacterium]
MKKEEAVELADKCLKELAASLEQGQTEVLEQYLGALAKFHHYSFGNMMMIVEQFPEASKVAGFHTWRKLCRCVKKGESGIAILAPMIGRKKDEEKSDHHVEPAQPGAKAVFGFKAVHVFDISQTEGEDLPKLSEISGSAEDHLLYLESVYRTLNIKLETRPMPEGTRGASLGGHVVVKEGLDQSMRFRILAHELAHEILHSHLVGHDVRKNHSLIETEAEAVAFVVCKAHGVDTQSLSSDYIHLHQGDNKLLMGSLDRIQQTATRIIGLIEDDKNAPINIRFSHRSKDQCHVTHQSI